MHFWRFLIASMIGLWAALGSTSVALAGIPLEHLGEHEDAALHERLTQMAARQLQRYRICDQRLLRAGYVRYQAAHAVTLAFENRIKSRAREVVSLQSEDRLVAILTAIDLVRSSQRAPDELCSDVWAQTGGLDSVRMEIPAKTLLYAACAAQRSGCHAAIETYNEALSPACYKSTQRGLNGVVENNACFAGDRAMRDSLGQLAGDPVELVQRFVAVLVDRLKKTHVGSELDLVSAFDEAYPTEGRDGLFTLLAAVGSSGNSGMVGWLQGLEDRLLVEDLNSSMGPESVFARFKAFQKAKIDYQRFRTTLEKNNVRLTLSGFDISSWNRHNVMAAFLGCRLRDVPVQQVSDLIWITAAAYEGKDFLSHIVQGVSLEVSKQNFKTDTSRYTIGSAVGRELCLSRRR